MDGPVALRLLQHYRPYICPFEELLPHIEPGARVLDIGCGGGLLLGLAAASGRRIQGFGFDSSVQAISVARGLSERLQGSGSKVEFAYVPACGDWPSGQFDVVSMVDVMHHVPHDSQRTFFAQAVGKVAPGGKLIYKDMALHPRWCAAANRLHDLIVAREWIHYLPVDRAESWALELGLQRTAAMNIRRFWYAHELRIFQK